MRARAGTAHGACYDARADQKHAVPAASCGQQALAPTRPERIEPRASVFARRADSAGARAGRVRPAGRPARALVQREREQQAGGRTATSEVAPPRAPASKILRETTVSGGSSAGGPGPVLA